MKIISKTLKILPLFLFVFAFQACNDDEDVPFVPAPLNIVEIASANPNLSNLVLALQAADGNLVDVLSTGGPFTVLAPNNDAFQALLDSNDSWNSVNDIDSAVLSQVLLNHVISGDLSSTALSGIGAGYTRTNADGAGGENLSLYFDTSNGVRFNNVSSVVSGGADIDASNGTIHIVDAVIGLPSIVDHALANSGFSSLVAALGSADGNLVDVLSGSGPFTVLAPDDAAFTAFLDGTQLSEVPTDALANILLNHVLDGAITSTALTGLGNGYTNTLATGGGGNAMSLYFNTDSGVRFNNVSSVATADVVGTNGIIHAVDAVIDIPSIVTFATADPNFSILVTALTDLTPGTDFVTTLSTPNGTSPAPFTVFAPTNDAFDALAAIPDEPVLTQVLLHHVLGDANVQSGNLMMGANTVTMLNGQEITVNLPGTSENIADVTDGAGNTDIGIVAVNVQAGNGVIHVLNKVMLPADE